MGRQVSSVPSISLESAVSSSVIVAPHALQSTGCQSVRDQFAKPPTFQPGASDRSYW
jgi:hypothetical protein